MRPPLLLIINIGCLCLYSCQRGYYAPNAHNVPLFQRGGEVRFMGSKSDEGDNTFDLQAAWSPIKHIGLTGNYYRTIYNPRAHGYYYDFGAGGYYPFRNIVVELYGGVGKGYAYNNFELNRYIKNNLYKYYVQINLGLTTKYVEIAYSGRFAKLQLYNIDWWQTNDHTSNQFTPELANDLAMLNSNKTTFIYEPALTVRAGWKYVKFQGQITTTSFIGSKTFNIQESNTSLGLIVNLAGKNKPAWQPFRFKGIFNR